MGYGLPFINNYSPKEYKAHSQIWSIVQDYNGFMYFANQDGVIQYDGYSWRIIPVDNNSSVRSLGIDSNGKIYVGATGEFGVLNITNDGNIKYNSLSNKLPVNIFQPVWNIMPTTKGIYFMIGRNLILKYCNDTIIIVKKQNKINRFRSFKINDDIFIYDYNNGLHKIVNDTIKKFRGINILENKEIFSILKYENKKYLIFTEKDGIFLFDIINNVEITDNGTKNYQLNSEIKFSKFNTQVDKYLTNSKIYKTINIKNGNIAIATLQGGMILINNKGELIKILTKKKGLLSNGIYWLFSDREDNLWCGLDYGISKIEICSPFTFFNDKNGLEGILVTVTNFNNKIYTGNYSGLYYLPEVDLNKPEITHSILPVSKKHGYIFDFLNLKDTNTGYEVLIASSLREIILIDSLNRIRKIKELYGCDNIIPSKRIKNRFFLGHPGGVNALRINFPKYGGDINNVTIIDEGPIQKFDKNVFKMTIDKSGDLWIGSDNNGLYWIKFNNNEDLEKNEVLKFDTISGLPSINNIKPYYVNNKLIIATKQGIYKPTCTTINSKINNSYKFMPDTSFGIDFSKNNINILTVKSDNNNIWMGTTKGVFQFIVKPDGSYKKIISPFKRINDFPINNIYIENNGDTWFCAENALFYYNSKVERKDTGDINIFIREVSIGNDSVIFFGNTQFYETKNGKYVAQQIYEHKIPIDYKQNTLLFKFSSPYFTDESSNQYKYCLIGFNDKCSGWTYQTTKEYTNLPSGNFEFKVVTKNIYGDISKAASFKFKINPPWYNTIFAYLGYVLILIFIIYYGIKIYTRRLKAANQRLEEIVSQRTAEIVQQKEEILTQNEQLEKLSIVASKTDNAVSIMDAKGNYQWINEGYTRLYGYTLGTLLRDKTRNIIGTNTNLNIKDLINIWYGDKKTIIYESLNNTFSGEKIWIQTTLTPILDDKKNVIKLVAIDTDIRELKNAESEINQQKEEIEAQKDEIEAQRDLAINQRDEITLQKKEMTDSIIYAKRIQRAIFPSKNFIDYILKDYFIFYQPRDIVSGDFYWLSEKNNKIIIAAADCTGHGVPGAFMSIIGITFLNEIVNSNEILKANEILNNLRKMIISSLHQTGKENEAKDGMDIALCIYDKSKKELQYAGANNQLIIVNNNELTEIKPDKMPISIFKGAKKSFTNHVIKLSKNDTIYIFTDGFSDQFGGPKGKKLKSQNFKQLLLKIQGRTMFEQKLYINKIFETWKGKLEQVDDILIIGVNFSDL